ncbi:hypothetical protein ACTJLC_23890 [Paraburkholderia sp. 22099]|jgi:hypothetical protein|uniref:hypothetical protein n=1 Tax=Paraburkholderia sp. 22099 TaxID=3453875 RepID=UPI003F8385D2
MILSFEIEGAWAASNDQARLCGGAARGLRTGHGQCGLVVKRPMRQEVHMRVQTIAIANLLVTSTAMPDSDGGFLWAVFVTERNPEHRSILERRGTCGHVPRGDALDIAARMAREIAIGLAVLADDALASRTAGGVAPLTRSAAPPVTALTE